LPKNDIGNGGYSGQYQLGEEIMGIQLNVTEWMKGHVGLNATDYEEGEAEGRAEGKTFQHEVVIQMKDIDTFGSDPRHSAPMDGIVMWLGDKRSFTGGQFNMLVDSTNPSVKHMFYRIPFADGAGKPLTMLGHKVLRDDRGVDIWADITTLFIRIYEGHVAGHDFTRPIGDTPEWPPGQIAIGIIHISLRDGIASGLSFAAPGATRLQKMKAVTKFLGFYGNNVVELWIKQSSGKRRALTVLATLALLAAAGGVVALLLA
jgi:cholesterol oxidase